jgi:hypothetical protein
VIIKFFEQKVKTIHVWIYSGKAAIGLLSLTDMLLTAKLGGYINDRQNDGRKTAYRR